jgi:hypothetical protein
MWYAKWVDAAYEAGIAEPCAVEPSLRFCPEEPLTRAVAAYMMVQAKRLLEDSGETFSIYGVWGVRDSDYELVHADLGAQTALTIFQQGSSETAWRQTYEEAIAQDVQLIVGLNPVPYHWVEPDGSRDNFPEQDPEGWWEFSDALPFFEWLNANPQYKAHTVALYIRDEPFWPGPWRTWCVFWSSYQMTRLKEDLAVALPGVPTYYDMGSAAPWEDRNNGSSQDCYVGRTAITDEAFDYLSIYRPPFRQGEPYDQDLTLSILQENAELKAHKNLDIKFIYLGSVYQFDNAGFRMPTEAELRQYGCDILGSDVVEGILWYPWVMYEDSLKNHPELYDDVFWMKDHCGV